MNNHFDLGSNFTFCYLQMYFSIPDTTEISAKKSSNQHSYILYNIHINGIHHCSLRYSQLYTFNNELTSSKKKKKKQEY